MQPIVLAHNVIRGGNQAEEKLKFVKRARKELLHPIEGEQWLMESIFYHKHMRHIQDDMLILFPYLKEKYEEYEAERLARTEKRKKKYVRTSPYIRVVRRSTIW